MQRQRVRYEKVHAQRGSTGHKTNIVSTFRFWEAKYSLQCSKDENDQAARHAFPSAANSRNKILAINVAVDPTSCLLLLSYGVLTVTNPSRDALYKPVTVWPLSSAVICFQRISSPMR
jgi:hypothetical protein